MNGRHQAFLDAEALLEQHVHQRGQAIGRAGGVGNDVVPGRIILVMIDADDHRDVLVLGGGGDDDFFRAGGQMALGFQAVGEKAGGFDDQFHAQLFPRQGRGVLGADDVDVASIDDQDVIVGFVGRGFAGGNLAAKPSLGGIIFEEIGQIVRRNDIADGHDVHVGADHALLGDCPEDQAANASKTVDCNFYSHNSMSF